MTDFTTGTGSTGAIGAIGAIGAASEVQASNKGPSKFAIVIIGVLFRSINSPISPFKKTNTRALLDSPVCFINRISGTLLVRSIIPTGICFLLVLT